MEEKERFELFGEHCIKDNNSDARCQLLDTYKSCVILNEQDQKIKELEVKLAEYQNDGVGDVILNAGKKIKELQQQLVEKDKEIEELKKELRDELVDNNMAILELQQSQKQLAIEELKKIYNLFEPYENSQKDTILCANNGISFIDYLENQIKELKGDK